MRFKVLAAFLFGLILGLAGMWVTTRIATQTPSTIPPNAERREFNGRSYYIIPLAMQTQ